MEITCRGDCFLNKVCLHREDADPRRCREYLDKSEVIVLPMKTTPPLHQELTEYCRNRCVEEL